MCLETDFSHVVVPFDQIIETVAAGEFEGQKIDAGLIIHEGQLTYKGMDLHLAVDLGIWWGERTGGLPLPLGGNIVRKDLGAEAMSRLTEILHASIRHGLDNRAEALEYSLDFGRGLDPALNDRFVGMYVNDLTLDYGTRGRKAIERFLAEGRKAGLVPEIREVEFVG